MKRDLLNSQLLKAGLVGLACIGLAGVLGVIPRYFFGEEFLLFRYADAHNHEMAWRLYFDDNGRLIEALYWNYLYKIVGFNPLIIHALSFILLLLASLLATKLLMRVWPEEKISPRLVYVLVFALFVNWISLPLAFKISTDNGRISLILFFLAGLSLQNWAEGKSRLWLAASCGFFVSSIFAYENTLLLFPALPLLAWPLEKQKSRRRVWSYLTLAAFSFVIAFLLFRFYSTQAYDDAMAHPATGVGSALDIIRSVLQALPQYLLGVGNLSSYQVNSFVRILIAVSIVAIQLFGLTVLIKEMRRSPKGRSFFFLVAALAWIFVMGFLPYAAAGYGAAGRVFSSSIFGLIPLAVIAYQYAQANVSKFFAFAILSLLLMVSLLESQARHYGVAQDEIRENILYRGLIELMPRVESGTMFIFLNYVGSNSGCGPSLEMLYREENLYCSFISASLPEYWAIRHATHLEANRGGVSREPDWILIALDESGKPFLVEQLTPMSFLNLQITWESAEPIRTNPHLITYENAVPSEFYKYLVSQKAALGLTD